MNIKPSQFDMLSQLVDATTLRHRVLAQNVANVNTPGYQRIDVHFEEEVAKQLKRDSRARIDHLTPEVFVDEDSPARMDGNTVDIDTEMGALAKNTLLHNTYLTILNNRIAAMRQSITGR